MFGVVAEAENDLGQQRDEFFAYMFILRSQIEMGMEGADDMMQVSFCDINTRSILPPSASTPAAGRLPPCLVVLACCCHGCECLCGWWRVAMTR